MSRGKDSRSKYEQDRGERGTGRIKEGQVQGGSRRVKYEGDEEVQGSKEQG
jgi:hypothetical protein